MDFDKRDKILMLAITLAYIVILLTYSWMPLDVIQGGNLDPRGMWNHLWAFGLLSILVFGSCFMWLNKFYFSLTFFIGLFISILAEYGQYFSPGRVFSVYTIFINLLGVSFPLLLTLLIAEIIITITLENE